MLLMSCAVAGVAAGFGGFVGRVGAVLVAYDDIVSDVQESVVEVFEHRSRIRADLASGRSGRVSAS